MSPTPEQQDHSRWTEVFLMYQGIPEADKEKLRNNEQKKSAEKLAAARIIETAVKFVVANANANDLLETSMHEGDDVHRTNWSSNWLHFNKKCWSQMHNLVWEDNGPCQPKAEFKQLIVQTLRKAYKTPALFMAHVVIRDMKKKTEMLEQQLKDQNIHDKGDDELETGCDASVQSNNLEYLSVEESEVEFARDEDTSGTSVNDDIDNEVASEDLVLVLCPDILCKLPSNGQLVKCLLEHLEVKLGSKIVDLHAGEGYVVSLSSLFGYFYEHSFSYLLILSIPFLSFFKWHDPSYQRGLPSVIL